MYVRMYAIYVCSLFTHGMCMLNKIVNLQNICKLQKCAGYVHSIMLIKLRMFYPLD